MAEATSEYTGLDLETRSGKTVHLRNILMLSDKGLASARVILGRLGDSKTEDLEDLETLVPQIRDLLLLVADDSQALATEMEDWPLGMTLRVVDAWQEETQAGEAPGSDS
ncbi:phage tail assembly protein [Streptomyces sp. URMC 124]|uniref:phage tail assembly protein n=1 Tax=Streptomyces sp. URMC 124 TaxID=3423405 RepID=UPI003F1CB999